MQTAFLAQYGALAHNRMFKSGAFQFHRSVFADNRFVAGDHIADITVIMEDATPNFTIFPDGHIVADHRTAVNQGVFSDNDIFPDKYRRNNVAAQLRKISVAVNTA